MLMYMELAFILFVVFLDRGKLFDNFKTPEYYPLEKLKVGCCALLCISYICSQ